MDAFVKRCIEEDKKTYPTYDYPEKINESEIHIFVYNTKVHNKGGIHTNLNVFIHNISQTKGTMYINIYKEFLNKLTEEEIAAFMIYRLKGNVK